MKSMVNLIPARFTTKVTKNTLECYATESKIVSGGPEYDNRFVTTNVLQRNLREIHPAEIHDYSNYWLTPDRKPGEFILDLGCERPITRVDIVNTHNSKYRDRSTRNFQVAIRYLLF